MKSTFYGVLPLQRTNARVPGRREEKVFPLQIYYTMELPENIRRI